MAVLEVHPEPIDCPLTGSTLRRVAEVLGQMAATEVQALAMTRTK